MNIREAIKKSAEEANRLADQLRAAFPAGEAIAWNHQGDHSKPQSGTVIYSSMDSIGFLKFRVRNERTKRIVQISPYDIKPEWLELIQYEPLPDQPLDIID